MYKFDELRKFEFIVPQFKKRVVQDIEIYVQPKQGLQWVLIKVFKNVRRDPNRIDNKLEYLLDFLGKWDHKISSPQNFFN